MRGTNFHTLMKKVIGRNALELHAENQVYNFNNAKINTKMTVTYKQVHGNLKYKIQKNSLFSI